MKSINRLLFLALLVVPIHAQSARPEGSLKPEASLTAASLTIVEQAAQALGGKDKILAVESLVVEGAGIQPNIGQNRTPQDPLTNWNVPEYSKTMDLARGRMLVKQHRVAGFPFALATDVHQTLGLDGEVAYNVGPDGRQQRVGTAAVRDRRIDMLGNPVSLVRTALDPTTKLGNLTQKGKWARLDLTTAQGDQLTLTIETASHLPVSVSWLTSSDNLGDIVNETSFLNYESVSGIQLPKRYLTKMDFHNWVTSDITVSRNLVNSDIGTLAADSAVKAANPPAAQAAFADAREVAKGVWWLAGSGNHRSVVFEFDDHLTMFEAPFSEARTKAAIDKARTLSSKPLTEVIVSHHHFDHTGGLRAAIAEGLTIVTHKGNEAFFREIAARKSTLNPDMLARNPKPLKIRTFDDQLVLKDKTLEVDLYQVKDNIHAGLLLMAYVPRDKLLVQADLYDAGWLQDPWADNYEKNLRMRKLDVAQDAPIHGPIQTRQEEVANLARMNAKK